MKFDKVIHNLKERKKRIEEGLYNCIPFPFPRFSSLLPGTERSKYIIITASQKIGKSKFADHVFIYEPLFFMVEHPELKIKTFYFTLEMGAEEKYNEFLSNLLFRLDDIVISPTDLRSTDRRKPVPERILALLESERYRKYIDKFEEMVTYIDDIRNPTGINKLCRDYAESHGKLVYKQVESANKLTGETEKRSIIDHYEPDDPEEYRVIIIDNMANLSTESGMDLRQTINKMSKYSIILRNQLQYIIVAIQHQSQDMEGLESQKLKLMKPSTAGLGDSKTVGRDANLVIGLYSPFKYQVKEYEKYDVTKFRNYIRFMEIIEDRDYGANGTICPLFFNGASSYFSELPLPDNKQELEKVYTYIDSIEKQKHTSMVFMLINKIKNKKVNGSNTCPGKVRFWKNYFHL